MKWGVVCIENNEKIKRCCENYMACKNNLIVFELNFLLKGLFVDVL